jgi:hypothetical protein
MLMAFLLAMPGYVFGADKDDQDRRKGGAYGSIGGASRAAEEVYAGSLFTQIAIGVGVLAIIGILVAGSSDNGNAGGGPPQTH